MTTEFVGCGAHAPQQENPGTRQRRAHVLQLRPNAAKKKSYIFKRERPQRAPSPLLPSEDKVRRRASMNQEEGAHQTVTMLVP